MTISPRRDPFRISSGNIEIAIRRIASASSVHVAVTSNSAIAVQLNKLLSSSRSNCWTQSSKKQMRGSDSSIFKLKIAGKNRKIKTKNLSAPLLRRPRSKTSRRINDFWLLTTELKTETEIEINYECLGNTHRLWDDQRVLTTLIDIEWDYYKLTNLQRMLRWVTRFFDQARNWWYCGDRTKVQLATILYSTSIKHQKLKLIKYLKLCKTYYFKQQQQILLIYFFYAI